jgi:hypothetical protein
MNRDELHELTTPEIKAEAKKLGMKVYSTWSYGGGDRDHTSWEVEIQTQHDIGTTTESYGVHTTHTSGRFDGKAACRREAVRKALINALEDSANK